MESIGIKAVLEDANFQAGLKAYDDGLKKMERTTDTALKAIGVTWDKQNQIYRQGGVAISESRVAEELEKLKSKFPPLRDEIDKTSGRSIQLGDTLGNVAKVAAGALAIGIGAAVTAFGALAAASKIGLDSLMAWGEQLDKLGDMFGMTGEQASAWTYLMGKMGVPVEEAATQLNYFTRSLDDVKTAAAKMPQEFIPKKTPEQIAALNEQLADAQVKLQRAMKAMAEAKKPTDQMRYAVEDAQKAIARINADLKDASTLVPKKMKEAAETITPFQKALTALGVSALNAKGKMKTFDEILPDVMDAFQKLPKGVNATALAMDLFGARGGSKFLDFLRQGSAGLKDAAIQARKFGLILTTEQVDALEEYGWSLKEMGEGFTGLKNQIGLAVLPAFREMVGYINENILPALIAWAQEHGPAITKALGDIGNFIKTDVIPALTALVEVVKTGDFSKIGTYIENILRESWPGIQAQLMIWKNEFWNWLKEVGLQVSAKFAELTAAMQNWVTSPEGKLKLGSVGEQIGRTIADAIGALFRDDKGVQQGIGGNIALGMKGAVEAIPEALASVGAGIAIGMIDGFIEQISGQKLKEDIKTNLIGLFSAVIMDVNDFMRGMLNPMEWINWSNFGAQFAWQLGQQLGGGGQAPYPGYQFGGIVPGAIGAPSLSVVHGGEAILPARPAPSQFQTVQRIINNYMQPGAAARPSLSVTIGTVVGEIDVKRTIQRAIAIYDAELVV